ncbi:MAG: translation initiation factor IF-6 [Candidatus Aenigmarchaeota archaeon]|nr:translation initiation factor IF-6 [Candidatus Aenigmarchaeota archaeon]
MKILLINFLGDNNLGIYGKTCDKFCLLGSFIPSNIRKKIEEFLKVKVYLTTLARTDLVGIFCAFNSNGIAVPKIVTEKELEFLKELKKEFGINLGIIKTKFTALGNLILCNDKGALVSEILPRKDREKIEDLLGVECEYLSIVGIKTLGACGIATNKGCIIHRDAKEEEVKIVEEVLKVSVDVGTANFVSPFIGACGFANSNGAIIGELTSGPEFARISEALGLV